MTAYIISGSGATVTLTVAPGTDYPVRIAKIEVGGYDFQTVSSGGYVGASVGYGSGVYTGGVLTGGTAITPLPMRSGSPAATATARSGGSVSGTFVDIHAEEQVQYAAGAASAALNSTYSPAFDLILESGSTFYLSAFSGTSVDCAAIYFEELRENWSY